MSDVHRRKYLAAHLVESFSRADSIIANGFAMTMGVVHVQACAASRANSAFQHTILVPYRAMSPQRARNRSPSAPCGRSTVNPAGREGSQQLKCSNECLVAKRNARLAEALGINPNHETPGDRQVIYNDELLVFARANPRFCSMVEKSLSDFLSSDKKSQILAQMSENKRKFVHDLAAVYRLDTQMVDQEPNRSVQLLRRIDSRIPAPLLSTSATVSPSIGASSFSLGKLTDLRAPALRPRPSPVPSPAPPPVASGSGGAWRSVVARQPPLVPTHTPPNAWGAALDARPTARLPPSATPSRQIPSPVTVAVVEDVPDSWEDDT
ncbi:uncharacterized protein FIBRA_08214 [Fibroporia radiculosa]|uniref:R3H domain-containing protein n=1 Tax=Fibroporia radiculosa TaxID=599839 RepID=J4GGU3_9APHY|nr:uncharacterized protein FIBRA_08214 [Fibroporia radiculosa]CCM05973.1 predicted protein [Fibroporia radiculosa]